ncbi:MAG: Holliday junction branch migration protein RuvA [Byssovorax sp.]
MIGRLAGRIVDDGADGMLVVDVGGVGYEVMVPLGTVGRLAPVDSVVTLYVHTHVREDALLLYGFATLDDRAAFRLLTGISAIGPKIAMSILGALSIADLAVAVTRGETARLTKIPGVGKKTAERICLELKDKLLGPKLAQATTTTSAAAPAAQAGKAELVHGALTRMGFRPAEAERAIASLGSRVDSAPIGELVRDALAVLSK